MATASVWYTLWENQKDSNHPRTTFLSTVESLPDDITAQCTAVNKDQESIDCVSCARIPSVPEASFEIASFRLSYAPALENGLVTHWRFKFSHLNTEVASDEEIPQKEPGAPLDAFVGLACRHGDGWRMDGVFWGHQGNLCGQGALATGFFPTFEYGSILDIFIETHDFYLDVKVAKDNRMSMNSVRIDFTGLAHKIGLIRPAFRVTRDVAAEMTFVAYKPYLKSLPPSSAQTSELSPIQPPIGEWLVTRSEWSNHDVPTGAKLYIRNDGDIAIKAINTFRCPLKADVKGTQGIISRTQIPMMSTRMMGPPQFMEFEHSFVKWAQDIPANSSWSLGRDENGEIRLSIFGHTFQRPKPWQYIIGAEANPLAKIYDRHNINS